MTINERLSHERKKKGWNSSTLANASGVSPTVLHYLETGARSGEKLTLQTGKRLARALGITLDYLSGMYEEDIDSQVVKDKSVSQRK